MASIRKSGEKIRHFILQNVDKNPETISRVTAEKFNISRQAVNKHIKKLCEENSLVMIGKTKNRRYKLASLNEWSHIYKITPDLAEDVIWSNDIKKAIGPVPENVSYIWAYGFTEMFNNAIDHSEGKYISVKVKKTAAFTEIGIKDDGVGIFKKIQEKLSLLDERHAILELSKGKLTTDPKKHTGEGIFFTSRMFDSFDILSGGVFYTHKFGDSEDWILENKEFSKGTFVWMKLDNHTARTDTKIFKKYSSDDEYGFNKTVVPVRLAQYGNDKLISRSQAKRLLSRVESFKVVVFDFRDVETIGHAFADEIFRVFREQHPEIDLKVVYANHEVKKMIARVHSGLAIT